MDAWPIQLLTQSAIIITFPKEETQNGKFQTL